ncbi:MAG: hypothetical protein JEY97_10850 [Bacteroidales bacterium]|nr:hypothetical protein [Bacteroidales bacterium]
MSKPKKIKKNYNCSDEKMHEEAKVKLNALKTNIVEFEAFDPKFTNEYVEIFSTKINSAQQAVTDNVIIDQLAGKTLVVEKAMKSCRKKYRSVKYFVESVLKDNNAVQNEFGFNDYKAARSTQIKMIAFFRQLGISAKRYQTELVAAGMTVESINEIDALGNQLNSANDDQEDFKKQRTLLTQSRIKLNNEVYEIVKEIARAGKIVFEDNPAKYAIYVLVDVK